MSRSTWSSLSPSEQRSCIESGRFDAHGRSRVDGANEARIAAALVDTVRAALSDTACPECHDDGRTQDAGGRWTYCHCPRGAERAACDAEDRWDSQREGK